MSKGTKKTKVSRNYSNIKQHKFEKGLLSPPFAQLPKDKMRMVSWVNDRLPEMLWAALIVSLSPHAKGTDLFSLFISAFHNAVKDYQLSRYEWRATA